MGADLILRETHAPSFFLSDSFFFLKPLPPKKWLVHRKLCWALSVCLYLPRAMIIYYTAFHVGLHCSVNRGAISSFRKQGLLCWWSGKLQFGGNCTRKRVLQKVQRVCGVELTCIKKVFLHLEYPAGREPACAELHTLSSSLNKNLQCLVRRRDGCYSSPAGVDVWS